MQGQHPGEPLKADKKSLQLIEVNIQFKILSILHVPIYRPELSGAINTVRNRISKCTVRVLQMYFLKEILLTE